MQKLGAAVADGKSWTFQAIALTGGSAAKRNKCAPGVRADRGFGLHTKAEAAL